MADQQKHLCDLLKEEKEDKVYVSFEFFPPRTEAGNASLLSHLQEFKKQNPVFIDFTWGAGGTTSEKTTMLCKVAAEMGFVVNMHLTCTNMPEGKVDEALAFCKENGIRNIVALRGDPPMGQEWKASKDGFECALDLIKHIKEKHGDYFAITCAGYPEGHPNVIGEDGKVAPEKEEEELAYLKKKVDAGATCIITQLFYDADLFLQFVDKCRAKGITCPILPGMLPMVTYAGLQRMVSLCKTYLPEDVKKRVEELKEDEEGFKQYGIDLCTKMCEKMKEKGIRHFHFYTLNLTYSTLEVMKKMNIYKEEKQE